MRGQRIDWETEFPDNCRKYDAGNSGYIPVCALRVILATMCGWSDDGDEADNLLDDLSVDCLDTDMIRIDGELSRKERDILLRKEFVADLKKAGKGKVELNYKVFLSWAMARRRFG